MDTNEHFDFAQVFNASKDLQTIIDLNHNILKINSAYLNFLNLKSNGVIGQKCIHFLKGDMCRPEECPFYKVTTTGKMIETEVIKRNHRGNPFPMLLTATALRDIHGKVIGMIESFKDISSLKDSENQIHKILSGSIHSMAEVVEIRDPYTAGHQQHVTSIAEKIAVVMKLSEKQIESINISAMLHDIGKIYVPIEFLTKPGKLSNLEFKVIKCHAKKGYDILKSIPFQYPVAQIVCQHHERLDGSGYPNGLEGDSILLEARIIAVADVIEAMSSHRPYRPALGMDAALEEIKRYKGIKYDKNVVEACLLLIKNDLPF